MTKDLLLLDLALPGSDALFEPTLLERLERLFEVVVRGARSRDEFYDEHEDRARFIVGRPPLGRDRLVRYRCLEAAFDLTGRALTRDTIADCLRLGIRVLTSSPVLARPVGELTLGFALSIARDIHGQDRAFREGRERYGIDGALGRGMLRGRSLGFVGFGAIGRGILEAMGPFAGQVRVSDPRLSRWELERLGVQPAELTDVLGQSDVVIVVASLTDTSRGLIGATELAMLKPGAMFLLLSDAGVVDFDALLAACESGRVRAATDVFPIEPLPRDHPARTTENLLLSPHQGGSLAESWLEIGRVIAEDIDLMTNGQAPRNCSPLSEAVPPASAARPERP